MGKKITINNRRTPRIIRTCHDENCPKCGFPETIIVRDEETMNPLWMECSKRDCIWGQKMIEGYNWEKSILITKKCQK